MPAQVICKSHKNLIKTKKGYAPDNVKYGVFRHSRANDSKVNSPIWPEFQLMQDFMAVLVTCKFEDDPIKSEALASRQYFLHYKSMRKNFVL